MVPTPEQLTEHNLDDGSNCQSQEDRAFMNLINESPLSDDAEQRIRVLTAVACLLQIDDLTFSSYSTAIDRLSSRQLIAKQSLLRFRYVEDDLGRHLASAKHEAKLITRWIQTIQDEHASGESSATIERRRDALVKKAREYRKELDAVMADMPAPPSITVTELLAQQERNRQKESELKAKRAKVKAFQGLPPNLTLARQQLVDARNAQMKLIQLRERLLGRMAEGVA